MDRQFKEKTWDTYDTCDGDPRRAARRPAWTEWPAWTERLNKPRDKAAKRTALAEWAAAAGGVASGTGILLPGDLPDCQALVWLKESARSLGLEVREHRA